MAASHPPGRDDAGGWLPGVAEKLGSYVYLLSDPRTRAPFYVGKGNGERCFAHLVEARRTRRDSRGDYEKLDFIRRIEGRGDRVRIEILRHGLDESTALAIESEVIDALGLEGLTNRVAGQHSGRKHVDDLDAAYGAKPARILKRHRVVLIRIARLFYSGMPESELYEATRKWWRIARRRCDPLSPSSPQWAFAVHDGVVRGVFEIQGWREASARDTMSDPRRQGRRGFVGNSAPAMNDLYRMRDVSHWLPKGSQSPLRFVNCG